VPFKNPEKRRTYRKRWYKLNAKSAVEVVKERKLKIKKWFRDYKKGFKCSRCFEAHPAVIDFHHKDSSKKDDDIAYFVANGYSPKRIIKELEKCEVLCANCHRKLHYENNKL
jgi:hypothetical protein